MEGIHDTTQQVTNDKKMLVERLVDKENPEMVTFVVPVEIDDISIMQTIGDDLDAQRKQLNMKKGFLTNFVRNNLVIRTSLKGSRSVQIVDTINGIMREEIQAGNPISQAGKRILGL